MKNKANHFEGHEGRGHSDHSDRANEKVQNSIRQNKSWLKGKMSALGLSAAMALGAAGCSPEQPVSRAVADSEPAPTPLSEAQAEHVRLLANGHTPDSMEVRNAQFRIDHLVWEQNLSRKQTELEQKRKEKERANQEFTNYTAATPVETQDQNTVNGHLDLIARLQNDVDSLQEEISNLRNREPLAPLTPPTLRLADSTLSNIAQIYTGTGVYPISSNDQTIAQVASDSGFRYHLSGNPDGIALLSSNQHIVVPAGRRLEPGRYEMTLRKENLTNPRQYVDGPIVIEVHADTQPQPIRFENGAEGRHILFTTSPLVAGARRLRLTRIMPQENMRMTINGLSDKLEFDATTGEIFLKPQQTLGINEHITATVSVDEIHGESSVEAYPMEIDVEVPRRPEVPQLENNPGTIIVQFADAQAGRANDTEVATLKRAPGQNYGFRVDNTSTREDVSSRFELVNGRLLVLKKDQSLPAGNYQIIFRTEPQMFQNRPVPAADLVEVTSFPMVIEEAPRPVPLIEVIEDLTSPLTFTGPVAAGTTLAQIKEHPGVSLNVSVESGLPAGRNPFVIFPGTTNSIARLRVKAGEQLTRGTYVLLVDATNGSGPAQQQRITIVVN